MVSRVNTQRSLSKRTMHRRLKPVRADRWVWIVMLTLSGWICCPDARAADVVRTVVLDPTLQNVMILGLLVVIRTFRGGLCSGDRGKLAVAEIKERGGAGSGVTDEPVRPIHDDSVKSMGKE